MPGGVTSTDGVPFVGCDETTDREPVALEPRGVGKVEEVPRSYALLVGPCFVVAAEGAFFVLAGDGESADRFVCKPLGLLVGDSEFGADRVLPPLVESRPGAELRVGWKEEVAEAVF